MTHEWCETIMTNHHIVHLHKDYKSIVEPFLKYRMKLLGKFLDNCYFILTDIYPLAKTDQLIHVWISWNSIPHYIEHKPHEFYLCRLLGGGTQALHESIHITLERAGIENDIVGNHIIRGSRHHHIMGNEGLIKKVQLHYARKHGILSTMFWFEGIYLR